MAARFPSRRSVVMGFDGAVATSQPLAAQAGLRMLLAGGSAADAAVATAAVLSVVEPMSTGLGGDVFALTYWARDRQVYGLNGSGRAPYGATLDFFRRRGLTRIPTRGMLPVTVPGAPAAWADLIERFGRLGLDRVLEPAIRYADEGFPVSEIISQGWRASESLLRQDAEASRVYLSDGKAPLPGQRFVAPDLARTLRLLAERGPDLFYQGEIADAIVATSQKHGGLLTHRDLGEHTSTWVDPIHTDYRHYTIYECPPNGQGVAALIAFNLLRGYDIPSPDFCSPECFHLKMEALKLAMTDAGRYVADPELADVPVEQLLSADYAEQRRKLISPDRVIDEPQHGELPVSHDTVYLCAVDAEGNAVSFINSLYMGFGSGIVAEKTGVVLQNRGNLFVLDPEHPNCIAPHKRPYHTIIPAMVLRDGRLALCYGVMGGFMQPQGHVQVLSNIVDHGMDVQHALDAPRFRFDAGRRFGIEPSLPESTYQSLEKLGHELHVESMSGSFGGGQAIMVDPESGAFLAGSDPRKDGCAVAF